MQTTRVFLFVCFWVVGKLKRLISLPSLSIYETCRDEFVFIYILEQIDHFFCLRIFALQFNIL